MPFQRSLYLPQNHCPIRRAASAPATPTSSGRPPVWRISGPWPPGSRRLYSCRFPLDAAILVPGLFGDLVSIPWVAGAAMAAAPGFLPAHVGAVQFIPFPHCGVSVGGAFDHGGACCAPVLPFHQDIQNLHPDFSFLGLPHQYRAATPGRRPQRAVSASVRL